jgi:lipopolysaccharide transport system permease protein
VRNGFRYYLDVITVLAQKDFKIRYRNSVLGFFWSLLNPLAYMVILTMVFSVLLRVNIPNYAPWFLIGVLVWRFFSTGTRQGLVSILANTSLVTKVYLPRYLIVLSNNLANFLGSGLEFLALLPLLVVLGVRLTWYALLLPAVLISEYLLIYGLSLSLSSLNVKYRDFDQLWDIALQLGFFLVPLVYDVSLIPVRYRTLYLLNPVTALMVFARDILLLDQPPTTFDVAVIISGVALFFTIGFLVFRRREGRLAEEL